MDKQMPRSAARGQRLRGEQGRCSGVSIGDTETFAAANQQMVDYLKTIVPLGRLQLGDCPLRRTAGLSPENK